MEATEKKVSYTPGPWIVEQNSSFNQIGDRKIIRAEIPSKNLWDQICEVTMPTGLMGGSKEANAKLIAAAPELLKALQGLALYFEFMVKDPHFKEYVDAIEAIKKATS